MDLGSKAKNGAWVELLGRLLIVIGAGMVGDDSMKNGQLVLLMPALATFLAGSVMAGIGSLINKIGVRNAIAKNGLGK